MRWVCPACNRKHAPDDWVVNPFGKFSKKIIKLKEDELPTKYWCSKCKKLLHKGICISCNPKQSPSTRNLQSETPDSAKGVGLPLILFSSQEKLVINDIHLAISKAMEGIWNENIKSTLKGVISTHVEKTEVLKDVQSQYKLSVAESTAIAYYTSDVSFLGENRELNVYRTLNTLLAKRDIKKLELFKPFLYTLITGLGKLPNFVGTVFRALDSPISRLSKQYRAGSEVVWIAFTSTSKNKDMLTTFGKKDKGTWMILNVKEGKDVSAFSLYPEDEVLLLPNAHFTVNQLITDVSLKKLLNVSENLDAMTLEQLPTPEKERLMKY